MSATGSIYSRNAAAEITAELDEDDTEALVNSEGIVVRIRGDGQVYRLLLTTGQQLLLFHLFCRDVKRWFYCQGDVQHLKPHYL